MNSLKLSKIKRAFADADGILLAKDVADCDLDGEMLSGLVARGYVELAFGKVYRWIDESELDEWRIISRRFPFGILCERTALEIYGYIPAQKEWHIAVGKSFAARNPRFSFPTVRLHRYEAEKLHIGVKTAEINGHSFSVCDRDRAMCEFLKNQGKIERPLLYKAVAAYINDSKKDVENLVSYSRIFQVHRRVDDWLLMWLGK